MIKLLLTVQISYIEYSKAQTLVNATGNGLHIYGSHSGVNSSDSRGETDGYTRRNISFKNLKKRLLFKNESCRIIKHSKSARRNENKNCQGYEKKKKSG
ncbi:MAG: hypothetical protein C0413_00785 [Clostridiales bacterium]|nr:hypothetical protein [Clostridiales bacterium]